MKILLMIAFLYFTFSVLYNLYFSLLSKGRKRVTEAASVQHRIAVFIPAYKEDGVIVDTAEKALNQSYPSDKYDVIVIADSLKDQTLIKLRKLPIKVFEFFFQKSTKAKAINSTYRNLREGYDIAVVLDADNVMDNDFLTRVNEGYSSGFVAMQGQRVAKNADSPMAILDGISEAINNSIFRKGHQIGGLSSALIGSAMAFDFKIYKKYMQSIDAIGGFDKELELSLLRDKIKIHYLEDAIVYDEKVSNSEVFTKQRTRWIAAQIRYGLKSFRDAFGQLVKTGNVDYFDKSLQFIMPPRIILLGILTFFFSAFLLIDMTWALAWGASLLCYLIALLVAVSDKYKMKDLVKVMVFVPKTFILMVRSLLSFKKAKNNFLHTPHQLKSQEL